MREERKIEELKVLNLERNEGKLQRDKEEMRRKMEMEQNERKAKLN